MKSTLYIKITLLLLIVWMLGSCKKEKVDPPADTNNTADFSIFNSWKSVNEDLPTQNYKDLYSGMELTIKDSNKYFTWTWVKKDASKVIYTGYVSVKKSNARYINGQAIWDINMELISINSNPAVGAWKGIYTNSIDAKTLLLNVESTSLGSIQFPKPENGIGSGENGNSAVFKFTLK